MSNESQDNLDVSNLFNNLPTVSTGNEESPHQLNINRILRFLEQAIHSGNSDHASSIVKLLALKKVQLKIQFLGSSDEESQKIIDGQSVCRVTLLIINGDQEIGPRPLLTKPCYTLQFIKQKITQLFKLPSDNQLWTMDGIIMEKENLTLAQYDVKHMESQILIWITEPKCDIPLESVNVDENSLHTWACDICTFKNVLTATSCELCSEEIEGASNANKFETYNELLNLSEIGRSPNYEEFECPICFDMINKFDGVTLQGCLHSFCLECIQKVVDNCETLQVKCPYLDADVNCENNLLETEIRDLLVPEKYLKHLERTMKLVECQMLKTMHYLTPDCKGWWERIDDAPQYQCPVCKGTNCLDCKVIHENESCDDYKTRIRNTKTDDQSQEMLKQLLARGQAMTCPQCGAIIQKKVGCDNILCSQCKTELCWATKGRRWGPGGRGDTSGGCRCGVNGIKCHPVCEYCH